MAIQKYGKQQRLMNNHKYTVTFKAKGITKITTFTSRYSPMYSTLRIIRNDLGDIFEEIPDDAINFSIWQASLLAAEIADEDFFTDGIPSVAVKQYVRYKSEYTILRRILLHLSAYAGEGTKTLGEFTVTEKNNAPYIKDLLGTIGSELNKWEIAITTPITNLGATRALTNYPYPLNDRVSF